MGAAEWNKPPSDQCLPTNADHSLSPMLMSMDKGRMTSPGGSQCHQTLKTAHCIIFLNPSLRRTSLNATTINWITVISSIFHQTDFVTGFVVYV